MVTKPKKKPHTEEPKHAEKAVPATSGQIAAQPSDLPADLATYDRAFGLACFTALAAQIDAVAERSIVSTRTDVEKAANKALELAAYAADLAADLAALPEKSFSIAQVWSLARYASVVVYLSELARTARAAESRAKIPADLDKRSNEVEKRMQALTEYLFSGDPVIGPMLVALAPGNDYRDRAQDMLGYAGIYELKPAEVARDPKNYVATDVDEARLLAGQIFAALAAATGPGGAAVLAQLARSWTLLSPVYADVRATVLWLGRADSSLEERFPRLYSAGRSKPVRTPKPAPPPQNETTDALKK